jgi:HD-GYP domain-containing protein (c-di-GMP phosphodiesterase class II)
MQAEQANQASLMVELMQIAIAAPDVPTAVTPILERMVQDTAADGAIYFQKKDQIHVARSFSGAMPESPLMDQILKYGLPAETPLMIALNQSPQPFFFNRTDRDDVTTGFPELGVVSLAAAPVRAASGEFVGALLMHTFDLHTWQPDEANLIASIAGAPAGLVARLVAEEQTISAHERTLRALGYSVEQRDQTAHGHTDRVTELALETGSELALSDLELRSLRLGAYLHDIGNMAIPDSILLKPGPLDDGERSQMRQHTVIGHQFAVELDCLSDDSLSVIRSHHEHWDGSGYPDQLSGDKIPLLARIFAVCDVYDALTNERPYKNAWTQEEAVAEIQSHAGIRFDQDVVDAFLNILSRHVDHSATFEDKNGRS